MTPNTTSDAERSGSSDGPVRNATIGIVPARGGSERLPGKNRELVGDLTLVERAIEHGLEFGLDRVVVSTDDAWIIDRCVRYPVTCLRRPTELATRTATTDDVIHHVLDDVDVEDSTVVVLLQPTSPFVDRGVLDRCLAAVARRPTSLAITVCPLPKPSSWLHVVDERGALDPVDLGGQLRCPTGAVYAFVAGNFRRVRRLSDMPKVGVDVAAHHSIDIDEPYELVVARALYDAGMGDDLLDRREGRT